MSIRARQDPKRVWYKLPYLVGEADVHDIVRKWPREWLHPSDIGVGTSKVGESISL